MIVMGWLRWRVTQSRVRKAAAQMLDRSGDHAFFASHEEAWRAQGAGDTRKAKFKKAVCKEIARSIQRREVLRAIIPPARRREPARDRETGRGDVFGLVGGKVGFIEPISRARRVK